MKTQVRPNKPIFSTVAVLDGNHQLRDWSCHRTNLRSSLTGMALCLGLSFSQGQSSDAGPGVQLSANATLTAEIRQQLEAQKTALATLYFEFTTINRGTIPNWNYEVAPTYRAYVQDGQNL